MCISLHTDIGQDPLVNRFHNFATVKASRILYDFHTSKPPLIEGVCLGAHIWTIGVAIYGVALFVGDKYNIHKLYFIRNNR